MTKQSSSSCERNQKPILDVLSRVLKDRKQVLEIGSGTGQHAVYFAPHLSHLLWHTSDDKSNHASINAWIKEFPSRNLQLPFEFLIGKHPWPSIPVDAIFTANTTHIMAKDNAKEMMKMVADNLQKGGIFCQYGPFNLDGNYTSEGNREFDIYLKQNGCGGIRDINELSEWGTGLRLIEKVVMPANNFLLIWESC
ncbi:DUF938 domain-containing protein [Psychromonas sp. RZ22]|uniref:DUF938 domain-containing protein n=1 Tax=Psychromonas algarum TaxID=2555643 RepID=UPI001068133D|nr:DUF938 domain-containing protein [Psychromonas sp. RZ22]TEW53267.1 DUF938 domain-containing protein [Psychromonas sp. RZ22]